MDKSNERDFGVHSKKRMILKIVSILMCTLLLGGCWDYKGMDELTIVAGIAIDLDKDDPDVFALTFEVVDMSTPSEQGEVASTLLETKGKTITEAVYNANRKLNTNMYFGNAEVLVLSHQLVEEKGLDPIIDPFLRDSGIRDNMYVLVSGNETAKEIIEPSDQIVSFHLNSNISEDRFSANSTRLYELYQVYNILEENTTELALPVVLIADKESKDIDLNGMALFQGSKKIGNLSNEDTSYYLLAVSKLNGGSFELTKKETNGNEDQYIAFVDRESAPSHDFTFDGEHFTFIVKLDMIVSVVEFFGDWGEINEALTYQFEQEIAEMLSKEIQRVILSVHGEYGIDFIGFADKIHDKDPQLWKKVRDNWQDYLKSANVQIDCKVLVNDTGLIKQQ